MHSNSGLPQTAYTFLGPLAAGCGGHSALMVPMAPVNRTECPLWLAAKPRAVIRWRLSGPTPEAPSRPEAPHDNADLVKKQNADHGVGVCQFYKLLFLFENLWLRGPDQTVCSPVYDGSD